MSRTLMKLEPAAQAAARMLSNAGLLLLIAFAFATLVDGLSRHLFSLPIDTVGDLGPLTVAVSVSCCFPQTFLEGRNIVIRMTEKIFAERTNRALDVVAALIATLVMGLFAWRFLLFAMDLVRSGEVTAMLRIPVSPFWFVVATNLWLTVLAQAIVTARLVEKALARPVGHPVAAPAEAE